jgi:hypothetical protein
VGYPDFEAFKGTEAPDSKIVVLNSRNRATVEESLKEKYSNGRKLVHRWWFPEEYRDLTPRAFLGTIIDPRRWRTGVDYFLYRKLPTDLGGVDAYAYFSRDISPETLRGLGLAR